MDLFDIAAKISLDSKEFEAGMEKADSQGSTFATKLKSGLGTAAKVGGAAIAAIGVGAVALGKKFISSATETATYGDEIDKMSQKLGLSKEAYQEWDYVLGQSGADITSMSTGLKTLTNKLDDAKNGGEDAQKMFETLGLSLEDLQSMTREDVFSAVITGFQGMEDSTERAALANDLFGKSGQELTPLFNTTIEETNQLKQAAHDLGFVMSDEAVTSAADFKDALDTLQRTIGGMKNNLMSQFLPSITKVIDGLTAIFGGDSGGVAQISEGLTEIINTLSEKAPEFLNVGFQIIESIGMAITENLPSLIERGGDLLLNGILPGIISNLPAIVETAFTVLAQFVSAIGQALPTLIPAAVEMVIQIVESLLDNIDLLIDAAIQLIIGLAEGLVDAIPILVEKAPEIIEKLLNAIIKAAPKLLDAGVKLIDKLWEGIESLFTDIAEWGGKIIDEVWSGLSEAISSAVQWGKDLISNFWSGIESKLSWLWDGVKGIAGGIADFLGFSEPKKGPLSNFHTFAPDMMNLFMKGINDNKDKLTETVANAFDFRDAMTGPEYNGGFAFAGAGGYSVGMPTIDLLIDGKTLVGSTREHSDRSFGEMEKIRARWDGDQNEH